MLNQSTSPRAAPALRLRGVVLGKCIKPNAFGNALGSSLASENSGSELTPSERRNLDYDDPKMVALRAQSSFGKSTYQRNPIAAIGADEIAQWRGASAQDLLGKLSPVRFASNESKSFFADPYVVSSGVNADGNRFDVYNTEAVATAVRPQPTLDIQRLPLDNVPSGTPSFLSQGRSSMRAFWQQQQDSAVKQGGGWGAFNYILASGMEGLGNFGYDVMDAGHAVYENPQGGTIGLRNGLINFGTTSFNGAANTLKTSLNGYAMLSEEGGLVSKDSLSWFKQSTPYNITPLMTPENRAEAGGELFFNLGTAAVLQFKGDWNVSASMRNGADWLAPRAGQMLEQYAYKTGLQMYAVPPEFVNSTVDSYVSGLYKLETPTGKASGLFEVEQTGPYNYRVPAGKTTIDIDGYKGTTMLDAKFIEQPGISPYINDSNAPAFLKQKILNEQKWEFERYKAAIDDPAVPFSRLDVLINEPKAVPYFKSLMEQYSIPGNVKVVPTKIPQKVPRN